MESLRELYKIGVGPSSSHTMGPQRIAKHILKLYPEASRFHVDLYGSLSLTGKGHLTDYIIEKTFAPKPVSFSFRSDSLPFHPNGMIVHIYDDKRASFFAVRQNEIRLPYHNLVFSQYVRPIVFACHLISVICWLVAMRLLYLCWR